MTLPWWLISRNQQIKHYEQIWSVWKHGIFWQFIGGCTIATVYHQVLVATSRPHPPPTGTMITPGKPSQALEMNHPLGWFPCVCVLLFSPLQLLLLRLLFLLLTMGPFHWFSHHHPQKPFDLSRQASWASNAKRTSWVERSGLYCRWCIAWSYRYLAVHQQSSTSALKTNHLEYLPGDLDLAGKLSCKWAKC